MENPMVKDLNDFPDTISFLRKWDNMKNEIHLAQDNIKKNNERKDCRTSLEEQELILKNEQADEYKKRGNDFVQNSDWEKGLQEYSKAISLCPDNAVYYANRAYCHLQLGNWKLAELDCNLALKLKPNYVKVVLRRARARVKRGNIQGAAKDYNLVLILEPKNRTAFKEYEGLYPELKEYFTRLGIELPEFAEMNPSMTAKEQEKKLPEISAIEKIGRSLLNNHLSKASSIKSPVNRNSDNNFKLESNQNNSLKYKETQNGDYYSKNTRDKTNYKIISPIQFKPSHLRSNLSLKRIDIEDVYVASGEDLEGF